MLVLAAGFGTFLLFLALGLLALAVTAALDKALGKEKALLLYAAGVVAFTWFVVKPTAPPPDRKAVTQTLKFQDAKLDPTPHLEITGDPFSRPAIPPADRNAFQPHSDTNPLPPIPLEMPPAVPLAFPNPPTIPGVAPAGRWRYRGTMGGELKLDDGTKLPDVPPDSFVALEKKPEDVFDVLESAGRKTFVYVLMIDGVKEGKPEFEDPAHGLKWNLTLQERPPTFPKDYKDLTVTFALIGDEAKAKTAMGDVRKAKTLGVTTRTTNTAGDGEKWTLRRSVDNLYVESLRKNGRNHTSPDALEVEELKAVAADMARVGETGKQDGAGWAKAAEVLQIALAKERTRPTPNLADVLTSLVEAYRALQDERSILSTLVEYDRVNPGKGDGPAWLGDVYLDRLRLPDAAVAFYGSALSREPALRAAQLGRGDALALLGKHEAALKAYQEAAGREGPDVAIRQGEALLRLGRLSEAKTRADAALSADAFDPRALLLKGAIALAGGDVQGGRDAFAQAVALPGEGLAGVAARRHRAEAFYDLGIAEWRLGHGAAARDAFEAAEKALTTGSQRGRSQDETVSPSLGRALVALASGNASEATNALEASRVEAPGIAYVEMLDGWMAASRQDWAAARPLFERALALAPDLREADAWISEVRLHLAEDATAKGGPAAESSADFEAAIRFAERATQTETDPKAKVDSLIREAHAKMRALSRSERKRFGEAIQAADAAIAIQREERRAFAIKGWCNYKLGTSDPALIQQCLRDFEEVGRIAAPEGDPLKAYAAACVEKIKHWRALEEKVLLFKETKLGTDWEVGERNGIRATPDQGRLRFFHASAKEGATKDGSFSDPTTYAVTTKLFDRNSFETISFLLWIPEEVKGERVNNVTFAVLVGADTKGKPSPRTQGIGLAYDNGFISIRVGGSNDNLYKDGDWHRLAKPEMPKWPIEPNGAPTRIEIERLDKDGTMVMRIDGTEVFHDKVSGMKQQKGTAELFLGGWSKTAERWDVSVGNLRVVRRNDK
jgi:tetratricopeptide (TPR) repeat protein